jgi:cyclohexa-1,5-dienecarbonyl-CoA hydratase
MTIAARVVEERGGAWLRVILNRPPANLLSMEMVEALAGILAEHVLPRRKWVTFEGAAEHFSYGAKIEEHLPGVMEDVLPATHALLRQILGLNAATAALVQGRCLGGGFELALACDAIIATDDASMGLPEINLCAFPPAGAALLPLRVGASRASAAILTGSLRSASEWQDAGLVDVVAPKGKLQEAAADWFDRHLAPRSEVAIVAAARAARLVMRSAAETAISEAEHVYLQELLPSHDATEGIRAFIEKRPPRWSNR